MSAYTIHSIDDSRAHYKDRINDAVNGARQPGGWVRCVSECVDGRNESQLKRAQEKHPYEINFPGAKLGHLGIWYTVLNSLHYAPLVTFEDDAMLHPDFLNEFNRRVADLPEDFDFFSLFLPRDQDNVYYGSKGLYEVNENISKVYARYGGVSMYYSKKGAEKIKALLVRDGITGQYDDMLYAYAKAGELNGYCSPPNLSDLVYISGWDVSIVQETDIYIGG